MQQMEISHYRSLCKHFFLGGDEAEKIKSELDTVYGASFAPSLATIEKWIQEFKDGNMKDTQDGTRSRSRSSSDEEKS